MEKYIMFIKLRRNKTISDEEKEAIGQCRLLLNGDITLHIIDDDGGTAYCGIVNKEYNKDLETVLNLIEKQSKEIEELKMQLEVEKIDNKYNKEEACEEMIPRYKIKAKIEEVDKDENASIPDFIEYAKEYAHEKLHSLLEKE